MKGNVKDNWHTRYLREVAINTKKYEMINANSETVTRKITQEEIDAYNRATNKSCHKLCLNNINKN